MTTAVTTTVELSHDGTTWVDVTTPVAREGFAFQRGRNRVLGEWVPGSFSGAIRNRERTVDPTNDAATFQARPGDHIKVTLGGVTHFRGLIDAAGITYDSSMSPPNSMLRLGGTDALAVLARSNVVDLNNPVAGYGTYYTGSLVDYVVTIGTLDFSFAKTIDTGDVATCLPDTGTFNALQVIQTCTRTEGGNSQLFTLKDGTLRWRSRYSRPSQVVTFGGASGVPFEDLRMDYTDDEWANYVNVNAAQHVDYQASTTSVTVGTGSKSFTLTALPSADADGFGFSAGAAVYIESDSTPTTNNMTGTVTSFDESTRALVVNITSKTGTATKTDWSLTFTEPATTSTSSDAASRTAFGQYRTANVSTYHRNATASAREATLLAASRAWPSRRISSVTVDLGRLSGAEQTSVLGLEIGDALDVSLDLGAGTPSTLRQVRQIDGIAHQINAEGSHKVTFTLGNEVQVDFTAVVKQNGTTVASTTYEATYSIHDGWCDASFSCNVTGTGTANTEIKVTPTGLPTPLLTSHTAHGTFYSYSTGGSGTCFFDGTDVHFYTDASTTPLGQTPNFALASGIQIAFTLSYPVTAGQTFTAVLTQASVSRSATMTGYYQTRDGWCRAAIICTANTAGSAGNDIYITPTGLPTPTTTANRAHGWGTYVVASSSTRYPVAARFDGTIVISATDNRNGSLGTLPSLATASGDTLCVYLEFPTTA